MTLEERISVLQYLGDHLLETNEELETNLHTTYTHNPWFTKAQMKKAIEEIREGYLNEKALVEWLRKYEISVTNPEKKIAIVADGLIPLAALHDVLCVFVSGNKALVKLSDKDKFLLPYFVKIMSEKNETVKSQIQFVHRLKDFDAVIVSDQNMSPAIQTYFGKHPHIIRRNPKSIAILDGKESEEDLANLTENVFRYFGFGARNVSKIYIPEDYNFDPLLDALYAYKDFLQHNKFKNNFDYNHTIFILNKDEHIGNTCIILKEDKSLDSRIASIHYERYLDQQTLENDLMLQTKKMHHVYSNSPFSTLQTIPINRPSKRSLMDYKDQVDTMAFLLNL